MYNPHAAAFSLICDQRKVLDNGNKFGSGSYSNLGGGYHGGPATNMQIPPSNSTWPSPMHPTPPLPSANYFPQPQPQAQCANPAQLSFDQYQAMYSTNPSFCTQQPAMQQQMHSHFPMQNQYWNSQSMLYNSQAAMNTNSYIPPQQRPMCTPFVVPPPPAVGKPPAHNAFKLQQHSQHSNAAYEPAAIATTATSAVYYCEPCDKEFSQHGAYQAHLACHESCTHPGCKFTASKKVVIAHFHGAHGTYSGSGFKMIEVEGQKFRVLLGSKPEEIQAWKNERRSKFPTRANLEKLQEERSRLIAAGGIETTSGDRSQRKQKRPRMDKEAGSNTGQGADGSQVEGVAGANSGSSSSSRPAKSCSYFLKGQCRQGSKCKYLHSSVCPFFSRSGRCTKGDQCRFEHTYQGANASETTALKASGPTLTDEGSTRLAGNDHRDNPLNIVNNNTKEHPAPSTTSPSNAVNNNRTPNSSTHINNNTKRKREEPTSRSNQNTKAKNEADPFSTKRQGKIKDGLFLPDPYSGGTRGTLLKKLVSDEIDKEENIILQCIHAIVQSNYFLDDDIENMEDASDDKNMDDDIVKEDAVDTVDDLDFNNSNDEDIDVDTNADNDKKDAGNGPDTCQIDKSNGPIVAAGDSTNYFAVDGVEMQLSCRITSKS